MTRAREMQDAAGRRRKKDTLSSQTFVAMPGIRQTCTGDPEDGAVGMLVTGRSLCKQDKDKNKWSVNHRGTTAYCVI